MIKATSTLLASSILILAGACSGDMSMPVDTGPDGGVDSGTTDGATDSAPSDGATDGGGDAGDAGDDASVPNAGRVVFTRRPGDVSVNAGVYVINADGTGLERISPADSIQLGSVVSPDGTGVLYSEDGVVSVMAPDGTGVVEVVDGTTTDRGFVWSSDSSEIVFVRDVQTVPDIRSEIWKTAVGGTPERVLGTGQFGEPSFSPDGTRLLYTRDGDVWVANVDGSDPAPLAMSAERDNQPEFSPDGGRIAYHQGLIGGAMGSIHVASASDGSGDVEVGTTGDAPRWSPDGATIAYRTAAGLRLVGADGTGDRELVAGDPSFHTWSRDGTRVLYTDGGNLRIVAVADGSVTTLTDGASETDTSPGWL